jgi:hypothetical protein
MKNDTPQSAAIRPSQDEIARNRKRAQELRNSVAQLISAEERNQVLLLAEELEKEADAWEKAVTRMKEEAHLKGQ